LHRNVNQKSQGDRKKAERGREMVRWANRKGQVRRGTTKSREDQNPALRVRKIYYRKNPPSGGQQRWKLHKGTKPWRTAQLGPGTEVLNRNEYEDVDVVPAAQNINSNGNTIQRVTESKA